MMTISTKEVAALMRKDLRERFPHTKFSVRCATGTAAGWIDVSWTDGPVERDVEPLVRSYQSSQFNGMTDSYDQLGIRVSRLCGRADGDICRWSR